MTREFPDLFPICAVTTNMSSSTALPFVPIPVAKTTKGSVKKFMPVPTMEQLKVKSCWICLQSSETAEDSKDFTHPCKCVLIAHKTCMTEWITSLPESAKVVCPQCKTPFKFDRPTLFPLRLMDILASAIDFAILPAGAVLAAISTVFAMRAYGQFVVRICTGIELDNWRVICLPLWMIARVIKKHF